MPACKNINCEVSDWPDSHGETDRQHVGGGKS